MIGKRSKARIAVSAAALAAAASGALMFTAAADAGNPTVDNVSSLSGLVSAINTANTDTTTATIINLAAGTYSPTATIDITNTSEPITIQGPTPSPTTANQPGAAIQGTAVTSPQPSDSVFSVASGVTLNLDYLAVDSAGSSIYPAVDDFGTLNTQGITSQGNRGALTIEQGATGNLQDSTLVQNLSVGFQDLGTATLTNDTIYDNGAGGIDDSSDTSLGLVNTIVADNTGGDCDATATTSDHSIDSDGTCGVGALSDTSVSSLNLPSNPSATFGGGTPTDPPGVGSPAIGHADSAVAPAVDQRGYARPATGADIGAVQTGPGPTLDQAGTTEHFVASAPAAESYTTTWTATAFPILTSSEACLPASGSTFALGSTPVDCTAKDVYGTTVGSTAAAVAGYTFTVALASATPPTVTITPTTGTVSGSGSTLTTTVSDSTSAAGSDVSFTTSSQDAIDGTNVDPVTCSDAAGPVTSGQQFPIGTTLDTCSATNSNHLSGSATLSVVVNDTSPPAVTGSANITQNVVAGGSVAVTYSPAPSATDLVDGTDPVTCTIPSTPGPGTTPAPSGTSFPAPATAGNSTTTTVTCSATDSKGLSGSATFTVTINAVPSSAPSQTGLIQGTVNAQLSLTPPPTCNLGVFTPAVAFTYTCTTTTNATSTYPNAYLTIQDVNGGDTTGQRLVNGTVPLQSPFSVLGSSLNPSAAASPATTVKTAPTPLITYSSEVANDPVTLHVSQPISATEPLTTGTYAATVQLTLTETP